MRKVLVGAVSAGKCVGTVRHLKRVVAVGVSSKPLVATQHTLLPFLSRTEGWRTLLCTLVPSLFGRDGVPLLDPASP